MLIKYLSILVNNLTLDRQNLVAIAIYVVAMNSSVQLLLGMRLICSKIYLLFLPELLKIFLIPPITPKLFRSDSKKIIAIPRLHSYRIKDLAQKVPYYITLRKYTN